LKTNVCSGKIILVSLPREPLYEGGLYMEDLLDEIITERCDKAIVECNEYLQKEYSGKFSEDDLRLIRERLIYKKAVHDAFSILRYFKII